MAYSSNCKLQHSNAHFRKVAQNRLHKYNDVWFTDTHTILKHTYLHFSSHKEVFPLYFVLKAMT